MTGSVERGRHNVDVFVGSAMGGREVFGRRKPTVSMRDGYKTAFFESHFDWQDVGLASRFSQTGGG